MPTWQKSKLITVNLVFLLVLLSWIAPITRDLWASLDTHAFFFFNGLLDNTPAWQRFWAYTNQRAFDLVPATIMLSLFCLFIFSNKRQYIAKRTTQIIIISLFSIAALTFSKKVLDIERYSPSLQLEPVHRLSLLVTDIPTKDASRGSFPGEHTLTLTNWVILFWFFAGWRYGITAAFLACIFSIPRLVGGAHWMTDDIIGGIGLSAVACSWLLYTPAMAHLQNALRPHIDKLCIKLKLQPNQKTTA